MLKTYSLQQKHCPTSLDKKVWFFLRSNFLKFCMQVPMTYIMSQTDRFFWILVFAWMNECFLDYLQKSGFVRKQFQVRLHRFPGVLWHFKAYIRLQRASGFLRIFSKIKTDCKEPPLFFEKNLRKTTALWHFKVYVRFQRKPGALCSLT